MQGNIIGAFTIYSSETNFFNEDEIKLLLEIADDISFALGNIEHEEKRILAKQEVKKRIKEIEDFYYMAVGRG